MGVGNYNVDDKGNPIGSVSEDVKYSSKADDTAAIMYLSEKAQGFGGGLRGSEPDDKKAQQELQALVNKDPDAAQAAIDKLKDPKEEHTMALDRVAMIRADLGDAVGKIEMASEKLQDVKAGGDHSLRAKIGMGTELQDAQKMLEQFIKENPKAANDAVAELKEHEKDRYGNPDYYVQQQVAEIQKDLKGVTAAQHTEPSSATAVSAAKPKQSDNLGITG